MAYETEKLNISIPAPVREIFDVFSSAGAVAYAVGGAVRDSLLGREVHDWDVASPFRPEVTAELFASRGLKVIPTGIRHGTVTVLSHGMPVEVTAFRIDGSYSDSRHPDRVEFTDQVEEDLARRDFTVNAMAYSPVRGLCDPWNGQADLKAGVIRCVGDPSTRFAEDALRILRAFRFAAQLGFTPEQIEYGLLTPQIGNTYSGAVPLGLANTLDHAEPGDRIFVTSYGSGAGSDAFDITVTDEIKNYKRDNAPVLEKVMADPVYVDYGTYAKFRLQYRVVRLNFK